MKVYSYGTPSRGMVKSAAKLAKQAPAIRQVLQATVWVFAFSGLLLVWPLVKIGEVGHALGGWLGWDTRDWT